MENRSESGNCIQCSTSCQEEEDWLVGRLVVVVVVVVMIVFVCVCVVVAALIFIVMPLSDCKVWRRDRGLGGRRGGGGVGQGEWTTCAKQPGLGFLFFVTGFFLYQGSTR